MRKILRVLANMENYPSIYRCLFAFNIVTLHNVPVRIFHYHQHVSTLELVNWLACATFCVVCWKNMRWKEFFDPIVDWLKRRDDDGK